MVKILKTMLPKHQHTLSPFVDEFVKAASTIPLPLLPEYLNTFPTRWPFSRGDLYHWIPLLNRFDSSLETFCRIYNLDDGPQVREFGCELLDLESSISGGHKEHGFSEDGDRQLVESILVFSRILLENCGNRSIYASSPHLSSLLNSTSLSLVTKALDIGAQLARRFQASYKRMGSVTRHAGQALLLNHYNIDLERVQQVAMPFTRPVITHESIVPTTPQTPSTKGKEKAYFNVPSSNKTSITTQYASDLVALARGTSPTTGSPNGSLQETNWNEWGDVRITFYDHTAKDQTQTPVAESTLSGSPQPPTTPTPVRRTSNLGPQSTPQLNRRSSSDSISPSVSRSNTFTADDAQSPSQKVFTITRSQIATTSVHQLLKETLPKIPQDLHYELLSKLRVSYALMGSLETRQRVLALRILAIINLAYIHTEQAFLEKVLKQDSDEPRRLQIIYQLADLIHPPSEGQIDIPRPLQTIALAGLEALAQHQVKSSDTLVALSTSVNHGVLLYLVRKAVAEMGEEPLSETGDKVTENDEWRAALLSLLGYVATLPRAGSELVAAGMMPVLIEILTLRTQSAERNTPRILNFLDQVIYNVKDAFQILISSDGLDAISNLVVHEIKTAAASVASGNGIPAAYRSPAIDYDIGYFQQQAIKSLFKAIHHMMSSSGGFGGNFDRLLRNLIDSTPFLGSLREIIEHSRVFGSSVWTNAVMILNDFINNEPTSFSVIAEAGLSRAFLESVTGTVITMTDELKDVHNESEHLNDESQDHDSSNHEDDDSMVSAVIDESPHPPTKEMLETPRDGPLAQGILPSSEAISVIPQTFGAICLNSSGMRMFQASNALQSFFEIFESPEHVRCMEADMNLPITLGSTFDELVRHHPPLKNQITNATLDMVARVAHLCKSKELIANDGVDLWTTNPKGEVVPVSAGGNGPAITSKGKGKADTTDTDVEMADVDQATISGAIDSGRKVESKSSSKVTTLSYLNAASCYLTTVFSNSSLRIGFMEKGGIEYVLDLMELPSLPESFIDDTSRDTLNKVVALLAEQKPYLLMPSLLKRLQSSVDELSPMVQNKGPEPYFRRFITLQSPTDQDASVDHLVEDAQLVKCLMRVQALAGALRQCFVPSMYNHRASPGVFNQVNLSDYYVTLIDKLGPLIGASIRETFSIRQQVPSHWKSKTKEHFDLDTPLADSPFGDAFRGVRTPILPLQAALDDHAERTNGTASSPGGSTSIAAKPVSNVQRFTSEERDSSAFKNFKILVSLLSRFSPTISPLFQMIGKTLISKRSPDSFQRQCHSDIAESLAGSVLQQLSAHGDEASVENYNYWVVMLDTVKELLINSSRHAERPAECLTLVLNAFKNRGGFIALNRMLTVFTDEIQRASDSDAALKKDSPEVSKLEIAKTGAKNILTLYLVLVTGKNLSEAAQTQAMTTRNSDRAKPDYFNPGQMMVELRMAILPKVRHLWESDLVEKGSSDISHKLIDIIRSAAMADQENGAFRRSDKYTPPAKGPRKTWKATPEQVQPLVNMGYDEELAKEALFRCFGNSGFAAEYCRAQDSERSVGRNPVPEGGLDASTEVNGISRAQTRPSTGTSTPDATPAHVVALSPMVLDNDSADGSTGLPSSSMGPPPLPAHVLDGPSMEIALDGLFTGVNRQFESEIDGSSSSSSNSPGSQNHPTDREGLQALQAATRALPIQEPTTTNSGTETAVVTVEDLEDERKIIRDNLIDRCLDVINAHGEVTFEVSDLITTVVNKSPEPSNMRREMGETLVNALMSFGLEDDVRPVGKKIAAYAHLLALMMQDKLFYAACINELKENLGGLLGFVKLSPQHSSEESSPWISHVLLIVETLLSEDAQPRQTDWNVPAKETDPVETPVMRPLDPGVPADERAQLFDAILEILPRIGKDEALALAVLRILVILTRTRSIAQSMGEKKNIQRLFVMAKQLAGATTTRLQSPLMLVLRHIVENDETIKQIMRSEIKMFFDSQRSSRPWDVKTYLQTMAHLVVRSPELFVEVTNEMVKLQKWSNGIQDNPGRQHLVLQDKFLNSNRSNSPAMVLPAMETSEELTMDDIKPSTEAPPEETAEKSKAVELKAPTVENPDGVIHFLLSELLNYRDVEDKEILPATEKKTDSVPETSDSTSDTTSLISANPPTETKDAKKGAKVEFRAEDHPIYVYRCFILQCLSELLSSYNRTKIEFINFRRSNPQNAMTPSKPRSSVVNYLLFDLIPIGTLEPRDTTLSRKRLTTSSWAIAVLDSLLSRTGEQLNDKHEDEPDLHFVRKFVLENVLKAYREASASSEPLDVKYARMLGLADLMTHLTANKSKTGIVGNPVSASASELQLKRIMYEKGYIGALTTSIADIDLNFPNAKRAVKYILRPLRALTKTAIELSDAGMILATPGQGEEDEIASATSVSDMEDVREETPDLFRNSTLGMFNPDRDQDESETEDEDEDEEMYGEDDYDDEEMGYEEEIAEDDEDNISDEDEEIEGIGHIEGIPGDHGVDVEVILDDDDEDDEDEEGSEDDDEESDGLLDQMDEMDEDDMDAMLDAENDHDHGHGHVEIIDEDGNVVEGGDPEDDDEWQSDEADEEDYEARAAEEEEEVELAAHPLRRAVQMDLVNGPLGNLVRALGGDLVEGRSGAADILERMNDMGEIGGGIDGDPQSQHDAYMEDFPGEEDDEDDDEDMEDEEAMYDEYHNPMIDMPLDWAGDEEHPVVIQPRGHHHRRRHDIPSPFPFFPGGSRDALGGTLNPEISEVSAVINHLSATRRELSRQMNAYYESQMRELDVLNESLTFLTSQTPNGRTNVAAVPGYRHSFRTHRPGPTPRSNDDGTNPLLQRNHINSLGRDGHSLSGHGPSPIFRTSEGVLDIGLPPGSFGEGPGAALLNDVMNSLPMPGSVARHGHSLTFHVSGNSRADIGREFQAMFGQARNYPGHSHDTSRRRDQFFEPGSHASTFPTPTSRRWVDEAKLLFGTLYAEKGLKILIAIMSVLMPPAMKLEIENRRIEEEKKKKREEEERIEREKREEKERAARELKEAEEAEAAEKARAEAEIAAAEASARGEVPVTDDNADKMEGVESTEDTVSEPSHVVDEPAAPQQRITMTIRGREVDITTLGIDPVFLGELPEELQEEVIAQAITDRRSEQAATGAQPSDIDQEFLNALPAEIREEIIQQERQDRRRREREEQRRQAAQAGGGAAAAAAAAAQDMDPASILATLPPELRRQIIMEQDEDVLAHLPPEYAAQAAMARQSRHEERIPARPGQPRGAPPADEASSQKPARRTIVQMLDKSGVATLLRLMFVLQQGSLRGTLLAVLQNVSENRQNRAEVISTLLHILQDGSADMTAIERSFAHLSLRAKQPKDKEPKTPQQPSLKRTLTGVGLNIVTNSEVSPLLVVEQCLSALVYLTSMNVHVPSFFLTEYDSQSGLKRSLSKKGKVKDSKASKYALNSVLSLLDRKMIMENSKIMEDLSHLLNRITSPLQALERKQKEILEQPKKDETAQPTSDASITAAEGRAGATEQRPGEVEGASATTEIAGETQPSDALAADPAAVDADSSTKVEALVKPSEPEVKKLRPFVAPVIPDANLKLVVNIFVARECNNKTFRETLSTIKNLSCIPGAKEVFGRELIHKAQELGEVILLDLTQLLPQIEIASSGIEIQGVALAKFSPGGSDQIKLNRVLTALDHLFDPAQNAKKKAEEETGDGDSKDSQKQDLLAKLYESSTFAPMWEKLGACLSAIQQREQMRNVATILLPLIESLMVVCKNTTLKETSASQGKEMMLTSPPPESRMESLFFSFTEEHRKILNDLVRHAPKLMSGTFSLLVKNPKVLDFDNKRNYFTRSIHNRNSPTRQNYPPLQLQVRRDAVFHDSFRSLYFKSADEMKYGKLSIRFHGEEGVDAGGVSREWFQVLARQMFDPGYALFTPVSSDRTTFHPNHLSSINQEHLMFFKFIGRVIGKALYENRVLDCHFSRAVYKRILGKSVSVKDMESLDPEYYKSIVWMLENDITDIITETFSVEDDQFGDVKTVDLITNGRNIPVTQENKHEYVRLMVEWKLTGSVSEQLNNFLHGFHEIIPASLVSIFNEQELELLISGLPEIDVDDWKSNTEYHQYSAASPQIQWFWRAIRSFDKEERAKMLQFVTGTSKVPLNGFRELEGMNGFSRFNIHRDYGNKDRLPTSHTCFNQLDLPEYESYDTLRQQVLTAITAGSEYFGFA